jgi:hypothetical protein
MLSSTAERYSVTAAVFFKTVTVIGLQNQDGDPAPRNHLFLGCKKLQPL